MRERLRLAATMSHDPDTRVGCVVVGPSQSVMFTTANCFPNGVEVTTERLKRPAKYLFILHAERNAISRAARQGVSLRNCTMYLNWFPCVDCAAMIVQAGIRVLVADKDKYDSRKDDPRYNFAEALEMLTEGGVEITWLQDPACPSCGKHGVTFEARSCQSEETHGLDCGPYEKFFDAWLVCSSCGAVLSTEEVADAVKAAS